VYNLFQITPEERVLIDDHYKPYKEVQRVL